VWSEARDEQAVSSSKVEQKRTYLSVDVHRATAADALAARPIAEEVTHKELSKAPPKAMNLIK
jgi:hypothetical protein